MSIDRGCNLTREVRAEMCKVRAEMCEVRVEICEVRSEICEVQAEMCEVQAEVWPEIYVCMCAKCGLKCAKCGLKCANCGLKCGLKCMCACTFDYNSMHMALTFDYILRWLSRSCLAEFIHLVYLSNY
jgi:hypothetical protein